MDFYIQKQDIVKALSLTLGVVEKRQTLPILSNVLIEVDESSMQLTATDLESQISTSSTVSNFTSGGKTTAPAKKLSELCRLLPDNSEIHITLDGDKLVIESGTGKYNLKTLPSDGFPVFEEEGEGEGQHGVAPTEAVEVVEAGATIASAGDDGEHAERADHHEGVGRCVEDHRGDAAIGSCLHAHEDEPGV